jgi:hypothetical protein
MAGPLDSIWNAVKIRFTQKAPASSTSTYRPSSKDQVLSAPAYRDHLTDIFTSRQADDARTLMKLLFKQDGDVSATVGAYLTLADTPMQVLVRTPEGEIDPEATKTLKQALKAIEFPTDYTLGFQLKRSLRTYSQEFRYMLLLRGAVGAELVFNKQMIPDRIHNVDMAEVEWFEKESGVYKPQQKAPGSPDPINLDIPSFFVAYHRRDPTTIYPASDFVAAINTIAARQQVINDLYRIMQLTGFPRMNIAVAEEVILKAAPAAVRNDPSALKEWLNTRLTEIANTISGIRADQPFIHWDSVDVGMLNEKNPGASMNIKEVIDTLNSQNQAALKTMAVVIGRGTGNSQVASTEARIAAMNADQLNVPLADLYSRMFTFLLNLSGTPGHVEVSFAPAELRPHLELETQRVLQDARLKEDLSLGLITDEEYHLQVHNRIAPDGIAPMSGTQFMQPAAGAGVDAGSVSPNGGPIQRGMTSEGGHKQAKSKTTKTAKASMAEALEALTLDESTKALVLNAMEDDQ